MPSPETEYILMNISNSNIFTERQMHWKKKKTLVLKQKTDAEEGTGAAQQTQEPTK